ncbi:T9SS type A sorting domain-containing protein [Flavobacterium cellulosilyticum]|uniref:T9SS type A sorting domain-containing protein n=1 Tax=Flavobacterium cellulosilyticum TaxID=2541731 RepID=A0A4R5C5X7_9FLAO|nr:T9SS type A sorting domain-containing protein [Flavobacterium cellulosilyticum]TDD94079.1 T9SS type A sorting domain-containing protein [Flavobacterium cellulosilyticum]
MKKIVLLGVFVLFLNSVSGQNYYMENPEGFGAAATGGGTPTSANTVTVDTYAKLKTALTATTTANSVILVSGIIDCSYTSVTLNNKTIIGLPGAKLRNVQITVTSNPPSASDCTTSSANSGILYIKPGSKNVIIRNLIFEGPGAFDVDGRDNLTSEGTDIWVDHCEFQDGMDGNFDNKGACDNTTISWCKFTYLKPAIAGGSGGSNDHRFTDLIGSSSTDFPSSDTGLGRYSITFKNCYWADGCKERMPRARNAELHILNCYYNTNVSGSLAIGLGGGVKNTTCYVENTDFAKIGTVYRSYISTDGGTVGIAFDGCLKGAANVGTVSKPTYNYSVLPVTDVATYVTDINCGAGATLSVTSTGVISTSCPNLSTKNYQRNFGTIYPTSVDSNLNIDLSDSASGDATITLFSASGVKVYSSLKKINPSEKLSINVANLTKGLYLCQLKLGETTTTSKFIKK